MMAHMTSVAMVLVCILSCLTVHIEAKLCQSNGVCDFGEVDKQVHASKSFLDHSLTLLKQHATKLESAASREEVLQVTNTIVALATSMVSNEKTALDHIQKTFVELKDNFEESLSQTRHNTYARALKIETELRKATDFDTQREGDMWGAQLSYYHRIVSSPLVKRVCEIGFNVGVSTAAMMAANPDVEFLSFDLFDKPSFEVAMKIIEREFPNKTQYVKGDSRQTVFKFVEHHPDVKCDVIHIDGGHDGDVPLQDLQHSLLLAHCDTIVLVDDIKPDCPFCGAVMSAWQWTVKHGLVREIECIHDTHSTRKGWCVGKFTGRPCVGQSPAHEFNWVQSSYKYT